MSQAHRWIVTIALCCAAVGRGPSVAHSVPLQNAARRDISLNGAWQVARVQSLDAAPPQESWQPFEVPGTLGGYNGERAWFRRAFDVPQAWRGGRVWLRFGGVKWNARVLVNEQAVGGQFNGYDAFELDVTAAVRFGEANELRVGVEDWTATFAPGPPIDLSQVSDSFAARGLPKNRVIAPFGGHNGNFGIWDDVTLGVTPPLYIREFFVRPDVRGKRLEVDVTVKNGGATSFTGRVGGMIYGYNGAPRDGHGQWPTTFDVRGEMRSPQMNMNLAAGQEHIVTLRLDNPKLEQWTPQNPKLYVLALTLFPDGGHAADIVTERIGWRQMETRGPDFIFNGKRTHLLATSWWPAADRPLPREEIVRQLRAIKAANTHVFRTHTQPWPRRWYELADEFGVMMIPEGALWCDPTVYAIEDERFWKNYGDHLQAMARRLRNHPSVVMYSLENEMRHCLGRDDLALEQGLARMARLIKQTDPTRPVTFEADGDPGGAADVIGMHYPNEYPDKRLWPNDAYWMDRPRKLSLYWKGGQPFLWDRRKPLYIGEYLWVYQNSSPAVHTVFFGDEAYRDHQAYSARAKALAWRMQILAYRHYGVSGSPWTMNENGPLDARNPTWLAHRDMYRPLAAFLRDYDTRFFAGETVTRRVEVFNDTLQDQPQTRLRWALRDGARQVGTGEQAFSLMAGDHQETSLKIAMPRVKTTRPLTLRLTLHIGDAERFRDDTPIMVFARPRQWPSFAAPIHLFDPRGDLQRLWQRDGVPFRALPNVQSWDGGGLLVIGPGVAPPGQTQSSGEQSLQPLAQQNVANGANQPNQNLPPNAAPRAPQIIGGPGGLRQFLAARVQAGGRILVLEQGEAANAWLPVKLSTQGSTMAFAQMPSHPILRGLASGDLRWWRGDNMVSHHEPLRPDAGGMRPLVVSGTAQGVSHAPLLEVPQGRGAWLLCQMQVVSKLGREPLARPLLERMVAYMAAGASAAPLRVAAAVRTAASPSAAPPSGTASQAGAILLWGTPALGEKLTRLSLDWQPLRDWSALQFPAAHLLILEADGATVTQGAASLRAFLQAGGQALWHRPQVDSFAEARRALDLPIAMQPYRGPALRAETIALHNTLLENIAREDLYWLGAAPGIAWSAAPLSPDVAEGVFVEEVQPVQGRTYEAEQNVQLEGTLVAVQGGEVEMRTNGRAAWDIVLPAAGRYVLQLAARGTPFQNIHPQATVRLGDQAIGMLAIAGVEKRVYSIPFEGRAGRHRLTVAFNNDAAGGGEDRNLWLDSFVIGQSRGVARVENLTVPAALVRHRVGRGALVLSAIRWDEAGGNAGGNGRRANRFISGLLTGLGGRFRVPSPGSVVEAEKLEPQPGLPYFTRHADHVSMYAGGYIEGPVQVAQAGRYRLTAWGRGTPGQGVYPIVAIDVDGREIGRVEIKSDDWQGHEIAVELPSGAHRLRLRFANDNAAPPEDRNLWLDRLEFARLDAPRQ